MLASGVRSSCETIVISSDFARSLSRSCSFCRSRFRRPCSTDAAIELNAPVSSRISAGPSCGMRIEKSPDGDPRRAGRDVADRVCDRPDEVAHHEQQHDAGGAERDDADQHGVARARRSRSRRGRGEPVLAGEQGRQPAPDLADAREVLRRRGRRQRRRRADARDRDQRVARSRLTYARICPTVERGELPLLRLRGDEVLAARRSRAEILLARGSSSAWIRVVAGEHEAAQALLELVDDPLEPVASTP